VHVAEGVELRECEIGPNVTIGGGSSVVGSRLRDAIVGEGARIEDCDLHDSLIGNEVRLTGVSGRVDIGDHSVVDAGE
jgi:glucose-1-phosphate thymidylyltransferase